ncbi:hypothetical protein RMATCC62417_15781 [Rhizopus microsporus]|nr:hypothetical protein RMATCC62417_15781 [Rhizopus microsporus]
MKIPGIQLNRLIEIFRIKGDAHTVTPLFGIKAIKNDSQSLRAAVVTGKKNVSKLAVVRARIRRRLTHALTTVSPQYPELKGYDLVIYGKLTVYNEPWPNLIKEINSSLSKIQRKITMK